MALDLTSLAKAIDALDRSLAATAGGLQTIEPALRDTVRAGIIQHFEVAYELCWKFLQRWLRENASPAEADFPRTRKDLFRQAARAGLVDDPIPWFGFGDARNLTAYTYDGETAQDVWAAARRFLPQAKELLARLADRND
jgi:nucleotidyltransferase substrate binding protein (TIGR01987 family)